MGLADAVIIVVLLGACSCAVGHNGTARHPIRTKAYRDIVIGARREE